MRPSAENGKKSLRFQEIFLTTKCFISCQEMRWGDQRQFTLDHRLVRGELGKLSAGDAARVRAGLAQLLEGAR